MAVKANTEVGGTICFDLVRSEKQTKKAMLIVPGVTGNSQEAYIMTLADEATKAGYNVLIINPIGPANGFEHSHNDLEVMDFSNNTYISQSIETIK